MITIETSPEMIAPGPVSAHAEPVLDTLFLVARRADALARRQQTLTPQNDRKLWLRAEQEIFDRARAVTEWSADAA